jgi:hypothetical protein
VSEKELRNRIALAVRRDVEQGVSAESTADAVMALLGEEAAGQPPDPVKRYVRVDAVVMVAETLGPQDQGEAFAAVAEALASLALKRLRGETRGLLPIIYPVVRFEASTGPEPDEEMSKGKLLSLVDELTRAMIMTGARAGDAAYANGIRRNVRLEQM